MKRILTFIVVGVTAAFFVISTTGCTEKASAASDGPQVEKKLPNGGKDKKLDTQPTQTY
jgi:hypothetical protein